MIVCGELEILFWVDLVEGKDQPPEKPKEYSVEHTKTVATVLWLAKPLFAIGTVIIMDSGFCVLKVIVSLLLFGVYSSALIKKQCYWPKDVPGDDIARHFESKEVGDVDDLPGMMQGHCFFLFAMKEPDYILSIMSTYGTTERTGKEHICAYMVNGTTRCKFIIYPECITNHYMYRDSVDANNRDQMYLIALEEVWKTTWWPCCVFQFLLAITEVNCWHASHCIFFKEDTSQQDFCKELAQELINNPYITVEETPNLATRCNRPCSTHELLTIPLFMNFDNSGQLCKCKTQYIQKHCIGCSQWVQTYC